MQKLLFFFCLFLPFALSAQISIETTDLPLPGDEWETTTDAFVQDLDIGSSGGNQNWDFSNLSIANLNTTFFTEPEIFFNNQDDFPGADLVQVQGTRISFLDITDDMVYDMGIIAQFFEQPFFTSIPYQPPLPVRALPTTMGTSLSGNFSFELVLSDESIAADSVRIKHLEWRTSEIDAWGMLTTPSGTFDALREIVTVTTIDSVWSYVGGAEIFNTSNEVVQVSYNWLTKEVGIPVVSVSIGGDGLPNAATWWVAEFVKPAVPVYAYSYEGDGLLQFMDLSLYNPDSWLWEFGDGNTSTEQNPLHQYPAPGEYELCLTVENQFGANTACQNIYVFFSPQANFSAEPLAEGAYLFTDLSTDSILLWSWDFGDGTTSIEQSPEHSYTESGSYTVCLTVTNPAGSDTFCMDIEVVAPPIAAFTYENLGNTQVAFTDASSNSPTGWLWHFGDGETSTEQNPVHTYAQGGNYVVCLTANNAAGEHTFCDSTLHVIGTATTEPPLQHAFFIYPNPISEQATFLLDSEEEYENLLLEIRDVSGHCLVSALPFGKSLTLHTTSWPSGMYAYRLYKASGQTLASGKLLVVQSSR